MPISNSNLLGDKPKRDEKGRLFPGSHLAPAKRNHSAVKKLTIALGKAGRKLNPPQNWWDIVAEKAVVDKDIMRAIINKLLPNTSEITGLGGEPINIRLIKTIYSEEINESNEP